jgi:GxxExxY protein
MGAFYWLKEENYYCILISRMEENELSAIIVDCCYRIHRKLGPGLLESVYEEVLSYELGRIGLEYQRQTIIPVKYDHLELALGFRADIIVEGKLIIEIKSIENIAPVHKKQLLTYLKLTGHRLGLLVNFNEALIKNGIVRIVNNL